jgi:hypothetical protein
MMAGRVAEEELLGECQGGDGAHPPDAAFQLVLLVC